MGVLPINYSLFFLSWLRPKGFTPVALERSVTVVSQSPRYSVAF